MSGNQVFSLDRFLNIHANITRSTWRHPPDTMQFEHITFELHGVGESPNAA